MKESLIIKTSCYLHISGLGWAYAGLKGPALVFNIPKCYNTKHIWNKAFTVTYASMCPNNRLSLSKLNIKLFSGGFVCVCSDSSKSVDVEIWHFPLDVIPVCQTKSLGKTTSKVTLKALLNINTSLSTYFSLFFFSNYCEQNGANSQDDLQLLFPQQWPFTVSVS